MRHPTIGNAVAGMVLIAAAGLTACSGSGGGSTPAPSEKQPPQIQGLKDQSLNQDTATEPLPFQLSDADSAVGGLVVTARSSDASVIPSGGIALGGSGGSRTVQITPAAEAIGTATITVRAMDPDGLASEATFKVTVNGVFVSFLSTTNEVFGTAESGAVRSLVGFTFTQDADDDPAAFDTLLQ